MDLLAGYGSDSSADTSPVSAPPTISSTPSTATPLATRSDPLGSVSRARPTQLDDAFGAAFGANLGARIPQPNARSAASSGASGSPALGKLPAPGARSGGGGGGGKRMVSFMAPLRPLSKEELEEQPTKKPKLAAGKFSKGGFLSSLPPPKNSAAADTFGASQTMGSGSMLGSGHVGGSGLGTPSVAPSGSFPTAYPATSAPSSQPAVGYSNDAYRVDAADGGADYDYGPSVNIPDQGEPLTGYTEIDAQQHQARSAAVSYGNDAQYMGPALTKALPRQDGEEMLRAAMAAERSTAARHTDDPFADLGVSFKEVDQKALTYMDPTQKEAQAGVRGALGKAYEQQLRAEADAVAPDKLSKRKHQINSLYYAAKMKELELLERRGTSLKTKAETQAKYGW